jgi:hypothetical protein
MMLMAIEAVRLPEFESARCLLTTFGCALAEQSMLDAVCLWLSPFQRPIRKLKAR